MNKQILKLAIPNIISNIAIPVVGIVDVVLAGNFANNAIVGGVGFGSIIFSFLYSGLSFLKSGTLGLTAISVGEKNVEKASVLLFRALVLSLLFGFAFVALQKPCELLFSTLLTGKGDAIIYANQYFRTRIWAAPATLSILAFTGWFIGMQNTKIPMIIMLIISLLNVIFSCLFVLKFNMAVHGIALGTVIAQYVGLLACIIFYLIFFRKHLSFLKLHKLLNISELKHFFYINTNLFIRSVLLSSSLFLFSYVSAYINDEVLAINTVLVQYIWIFSYFTDGFAYAGGTLTGKFIGEKNHTNLNLVKNGIIRISFYISLIFTIIYFVFGDVIFGLISKDVNLLASAREYFPWIWLISITSFMAFAFDGIYIGATATKPLRNVMLIVVVGLYIPLMLIFIPIISNHGLWLAFTIFFAARGLGLLLLSKRSITI
jgi:MATE family multidrug resistance protein